MRWFSELEIFNHLLCVRVSSFVVLGVGKELLLGSFSHLPHVQAWSCLFTLLFCWLVFHLLVCLVQRDLQTRPVIRHSYILCFDSVQGHSLALCTLARLPL